MPGDILTDGKVQDLNQVSMKRNKKKNPLHLIPQPPLHSTHKTQNH